jgi:adenylate cyclase
MKRFGDSWIGFFRHLLRMHRGRPWALVLLFGLIVLNLCSEWPGDIARPEILDRIDAILPDSFGSARQLLFDHFQRRFPRIPTTQPVTIVEIDDKTLESVGQWPWPRNRLAHLIDLIAANKPLAIGLDIYMPEPDQTSPGMVADNLPDTASTIATELRAMPSHERILETALRASPSILGAAAFDHATSSTSSTMLSAPVIVHGPNPLDKVHRFDYVLASLAELQGAAHGQAMLNVAQEQGTVRRLPLIMGLRDKLVPSLPIEMLRIATGSPAIEVFAGRSGVQAVGIAGVSDVRIPTQSDGEIWLRYASIQATQQRYVSARDVLQGKVDPARFRNKLILVGLTGTGLTDMRTTALGELVPGIEIQAQAIEAIFEGRYLLRPSWLKWTELGFITVFGLLLIWYVPRTDSRLAVFMRTVPKASAIIGIALNLVVVSISFLLFRYFGLLADATSVFIILSAVMASFFTTAIGSNEQQSNKTPAYTKAPKDDEDRTGKAPG